MPSSNGRKVAVVTGGTAGVGRATVRQFAERGYDVAILARGQAGLDGAVSDVQARGCTRNSVFWKQQSAISPRQIAGLPTSAALPDPSLISTSPGIRRKRAKSFASYACLIS